MYRFLTIILFAFGVAQFAEYDDEIELTLEDHKNKVMDRINNYIDTRYLSCPTIDTLEIHTLPKSIIFHGGIRHSTMEINTNMCKIRRPLLCWVPQAEEAGYNPVIVDFHVSSVIANVSRTL